MILELLCIEVRARASLIASFRQWQATRRQESVETLPWESVPTFSLQCHSIRSDATNAAIWGRSKLNVTELSSTFATLPILARTSWAAVLSSLDQRTIMADLKPVRGNSGAVATLGMLEPQLKSVGLPLGWVSPPVSPELQALQAGGSGNLLPLTAGVPAPATPGKHAASTPEPAAEIASTSTIVATCASDSPRETVPHALEMFCSVTDAGPDILGARRLLDASLALCMWRWWFDVDCFAHQYHLLTLRMLRVLDGEIGKLLGLPAKYYSCLAMLMHILRDNARSFWEFSVVT